MNNNSQIKVYDTTLRDGAQTVGVTFSLEDKLRIATELDNLGIHYIEGGWPGSNPKDIAFFEEVKGMSFRHARISAFSSTRRPDIKITRDKNIQQLLASESPVATIVGKTWDLHVTAAMGISLDKNLEIIDDTVRYLKSYFDEVIFDGEHFFDGYKENPGYALKSLAAAQEAGADWIVLCDTNGGTLTSCCSTTIRKVRENITIPLGIHTHNDVELAVANSLIAVNEGITMVQGTINGLGERCGNANLCSLIPNLSIKQRYQTIPTENIKKTFYISRLVSELSNQKHPNNLPYVGSNAFAHKGGIHVSAVRKENRTYEHIMPESVGNRRKISISELSGKSNILEKAKEMGIKVNGKSREVMEILETIKEMEQRGYHFEGAEASFELLFKSILKQKKEYFTLKGFHVRVWKDSDGSVLSDATIKAEIPEETMNKIELEENIEHTSADGDGPVEAMDRALRKALEKFYPTLKEVKLSDYKVRILNEDGGCRAVTRVLITSHDNRRKWGTVGVSDNILNASWKALVDSLTYKLMKDDEENQLHGDSR